MQHLGRILDVCSSASAVCLWCWWDECPLHLFETISDTRPKYCACHAKRENDLPSCDFEAPKRAFRARLPPLFILWRKWLCRILCVPPIGEKLTTWRRPPDDPTTTRRRQHDQHDANTGPTPDPNYKREPFATHSGKIATEVIKFRLAFG